MLFKLPTDVDFILNTLHNAGHEAYIVGGCVRDILLNKTPDDWDITTSAKPQSVKELFNYTIDTGLKHGTVTIHMNHNNYEVTTYRIEEGYTDSRHPSIISFTPLLSEDLKRRDFTINAMAYNHTDGLVDLFDGQKDLENKIIRCVGNANLRFNEDALRMLRALRFSAQLQFQIEESTFQAICELSSKIQNISVERIRVEVTKLLTSSHPEYFENLYKTGITKYIMPEFDLMMETTQNNPHHCYTVGYHTLEALKHVCNDPILRYTILFHDLGKPMSKTTDSSGIDHFYGHQKNSVKIAHEIMTRWKFDSNSQNRIEQLICYHDHRLEPNDKQIRKAISNIGPHLYPDLFAIQKADILGQSDYNRPKKLETLSSVKSIYDLIISSNDCLTIKDLAINGNDLILLGVVPGPKIKEILDTLLLVVLDNQDMNHKELLIDYYKSHIL